MIPLSMSGVTEVQRLRSIVVQSLLSQHLRTQRQTQSASFQSKKPPPKRLCGAELPSVPRLANPHADAQLLVAEVAQDLHPDFALQDVGFAVLQGQPVRRRAYGGRPNDVALHLDALGRRVGRRGPVGGRAAVEAQGSDLTRVEVAQLPGGPVHLLGLEVGPLVAQFHGFAEEALRVVGLHLRLRLDGLAVLGVQAIVRLLDVLAQRFAQLAAQLAVRQAALVASFGARPSFLGLAPGLAAGTSLWGAAVGLVAVPNWSFNELTQKFVLHVIITLVHIAKMALPLGGETKEMLPSPVVLLLIPSVIILLFLYLMQKFGQIWLVSSFLWKTRERQEKLKTHKIKNKNKNTFL